MLLKRWIIYTAQKKTATKTSLSLSSPRGTSTVRHKRSKHHGLYALPSIELALFFIFAAFLILMVTVLALLSPGTSSHLASSSRRLTTSAHIATSPQSLFSKLRNSVRQKFIVRRPRGHRYYDYWQDEEHADFEPYPWKFMKRPTSYSATKKVLDDEYVVPKSINIDTEERRDTKQNDYAYNDPSPFYGHLRQAYESFFPPAKTTDETCDFSNNIDAQRALQATEDLQTYTSLKTHFSGANSNPRDPHVSYDIHNCPDDPPPGYPMEWNLLHDVLSQWPADDPELPASGTLYQGICVFDLRKDYETNYAKAIRYRDAEVPFVVKGDPAVAQTVERWNAPHYLNALLGDLPQSTETSHSGSFTYWTRSGVDTHKYPKTKFQAPTQIKEMTFSEWVQLANVTDAQLLTPESPHYYFRIVGCAPGNLPSQHDKTSHHDIDNSCTSLPGKVQHVPYLADELPFYGHTKSSLYVKESLGDKTTTAMKYQASSGTEPTSKILMCRFGMKGVMATNHFDGERNFVTVLSGERRYILAHPKECGNMALHPFGHPSARHSAIDWAHPDLKEHPKFEQAMGNEVVLQAGESLFIPSLWFHYIVSMSMNVQCNTRSGLDDRHVQDLYDSCGW